MKKLSLNELRKGFLEFFEDKGHLVVPSFSLVPENDPSILLINAGMTPLKEYFTGAKKPPAYRMATCQKCIRTLDIDRVGKTDRHGTFFEMLGNFSFGDYFKSEAIKWAWEYFTEVLDIPEELLSVSVYEEDEEAYGIWRNEIGLPEGKIVRLGKEDNFWEHGSGPCGPCSEIFFDRGSDKGCGDESCAPGCDCDRFIEVWNLVFTQFEKTEDGEYIPLEKKNIDTGMGLERLACVIQGVDNLFEVDTVKRILDKVCEISGKEYRKDKKTDESIRLITDHVRSTVMMVSDGIIPSNEGRGYVLRRLIRRAARHGKLLGIEDKFLVPLVKTAIGESMDAYPELNEKSEYIEKVIGIEEDRFRDTVDQGLQILGSFMEQVQKEGGDTLEGSMVFRLHDTYGFPYELTEEIASERGLETDREGFEREMDKQKEKARKAQKTEEGVRAWGEGEQEYFEGLAPTVFTGHGNLSDDAKVIRVLVMENEIEIALDKTPFYAESGGQAGDTGIIESDGFSMTVRDCTKTHEGVFVHKGVINHGEVKEGDRVVCRVDVKRRKAIAKNHTATHILHYALKEVLGGHVAQAGSYVGPDRLRFDFNHFAAMTGQEIQKAEKLVNEKIFEDKPVETREMDIDRAREEGATALFGEKYGDKVRVVSTGGFSMELCGGTHLDKTSAAGLFVIASESGVAAGVRRIEALTGEKALEYLLQRRDHVKEVADIVRSGEHEITERVKSLQQEIKESRREIEELKKRIAKGSVSNVFDKPEDINGTKVIVSEIEGADSDTLRTMCDAAREKYDDCVVVLGSAGDKVVFTAAATNKAVKKGIHSGKIIGEAAKITGGGGGGRPDMAQAGGKDPGKLDEALDRARDIIREVLA